MRWVNEVCIHVATCTWVWGVISCGGDQLGGRGGRASKWG